MISNATQEYLKVIYVMKKQNNEIRVTDIADKMNCSKPSVTKQLNILKSKGLINYETYGKIDITRYGESEAKKILAADDLVYILLKNIIGVPDEIAKKDSSLVKGVISNETLTSISNYISKILELDKMSCNFNIENESCRECISNRRKEIC